MGPDVDVPSLASVSLENVRGFARLDLQLLPPESDLGGVNPPRARMAVLIGRNGTNKSTLLRAIAVGAGSRGDASAMLSTQTGSLIGPRGAEARIELTYRLPGGESVTSTRVLWRTDPGYDEIFTEEGPSADALGLLVCGYGAARGITGTDSGRTYRVFDATATLFDYRRELLAPELTLRRLGDFFEDDARYRKTLSSIAAAIGFEDDDAEIRPGKGGGVLVSSREVGRDVPLDALADGYRVAFNWMMDVYGRALAPPRILSDGTVAALILVDEIDQHLHPELQTGVVGELERAFPHAQFVISTHSPLVALGADPRQLVVLHRDADGPVWAAERVPDHRAYSPEDVLTDDRLFDVQAHNPEFADLLADYDRLAAVAPAERSTTETADLRKVAAAVRDAPRPGLDEPSMITPTEQIRAMLANDDRG